MTKSGLDLLRNVDVCLSVELGRSQMKLKDVLSLGPESVVQLDRLTDELLDVFVNGNAIAKGEIVAQGNRFALKIVELAGEEDMPATAQPETQPAPAPQARQAAHSARPQSAHPERPVKQPSAQQEPPMPPAAMAQPSMPQDTAQ